MGANISTLFCYLFLLFRNDFVHKVLPGFGTVDEIFSLIYLLLFSPHQCMHFQAAVSRGQMQALKDALISIELIFHV